MSARTYRLIGSIGQQILIDSVLAGLTTDPLHVANLVVTETRAGRRIVIETDDSTLPPTLTERIE